MEVLKDCSAYLSNYEVLHTLKNIRSQKQKGQNQLATITYQTVKHLEETPCVKQNPEKIKEFLKAAEQFKLTKCEKLTLVNLCPKSALEIQLIIEDSEDRLSEEEVESLLQVISKYLEPEKPVIIKQEEEMEEQEGEEVDVEENNT